MEYSPEIEKCINRVRREYEKSPYKSRFDLRVIPKMPNEVRVILYGNGIRKERDILPHQVSHVGKTMALT